MERMSWPQLHLDALLHHAAQAETYLALAQAVAVPPDSDSEDFSECLQANERGYPIHIEKAEQRALTLRQLSELGALMKRRCVSENWVDPFPYIAGHANPNFGEALHISQVNLYQLNYYVILPASVPHGVTLHGVSSAQRILPGQIVEQPNNPPPHPGKASGRIRAVDSNAEQSSLTIEVLKGCFTSQSQNSTSGELNDNHILIDGRPRGRPTSVQVQDSCSYMECVASEPQDPHVYCSHFWGEPVLDFIECCQEHGRLRGYTEEAKYWVCAYANRQHDLGLDIGDDPEHTGFRKAMRLSFGMLLILDRRAMPFQRIWCDYEIYTTIYHDKVIDVVTVGSAHDGLNGEWAYSEYDCATILGTTLTWPSGSTTALVIHSVTEVTMQLNGESYRGRLEQDGALSWSDGDRWQRKKTAPQLLADPREPLPDESGLHLNRKFRREARFPLELLKEGMQRNLEDGSATELIDKVRILNSIRSHIDLNDWGVLELPDDVTVSLSKINASLHSMFALVAWPQAVKKGLVHDFDGTGQISLPCILKADQFRTVLELCILGEGLMTDAHLITLSESLPKKLTSLKLDLSSCTNITNHGFQALCENISCTLTKLHLAFQGCHKIADAGVTQLAMCAGNLRHLRHIGVNFADCVDVTNISIIALAEALQTIPGIQSLTLDLFGCKQIADSSLKGLSIMLRVQSSLEHLFLDCGGDASDHCKYITDEGLRALCHLPPLLCNLKLNFARCQAITDAGVYTLCRALPETLCSLELGFGSCRRVGCGYIESVDEMRAWQEKAKWKFFDDVEMTNNSKRFCPADPLHMDLSNNTKIRGIGLRALIDRISINISTITLNCEGCCNLSWSCIGTVLEHCARYSDAFEFLFAGTCFFSGDAFRCWQKGRLYKLDNSALQANSRVVAYRLSKSMQDHSRFDVAFGSEIRGVDEGDGWLRVGDLYLPMAVSGHPIVLLVEACLA